MNGTGYNLTVQAETAFNRIGGEQYLCDEDFPPVLRKLKAAINPDGTFASDYREHLGELIRMFRMVGENVDTEQDYAYYETLFSRLKDEHWILTLEELEGKVVRDLYDIFGEYHAPTDYLKRIIDEATTREKFMADDWRNNTLRLRILKQFVKYGQASLNKVNKKISLTPIRENAQENLGMPIKSKEYDKIADYVNDKVFDCLINATAEQKKQEYWLLALVDDLANGRFASIEKIKTGLYLLAMVYDLPIDPVNDHDHANTVELFTKYYNSNFVRLATQEDPISTVGIASLDLGINYKNWMEAIFLYYIGQSDLAASDKIKKAYEMVGRIRKTGEQDAQRKAGPESQDGMTVKFRGLWRNAAQRAELLEMDESEFATFLMDNYMISIVKNVSPLVSETQQNTAWKVYCTLRQELQKYWTDNEQTISGAALFEKDDKVYNSEVNIATFYGLWFDASLEIGSMHESGNMQETDITQETDDERKRRKRIERENKKRERLLGFLPDDRPNENERFCNFLEKVQSIIASIDGDIPKVLDLNSPEQVSRTAMITAAYYSFNEMIMEKYGNSDNRFDFNTIFGMFANRVNPYLEASFYAPLSSSNIFDFLIGFSCYCYQK